VYKMINRKHVCTHVQGKSCARHIVSRLFNCLSLHSQMSLKYIPTLS